MKDLAVARSQLQSSALQSRLAMDSVAGLMPTAGLQRGRVLALVATLEEQGGHAREVWKKLETLRSSRTSEVCRLALAARAQQHKLDDADDADEGPRAALVDLIVVRERSASHGAVALARAERQGTETRWRALGVQRISELKRHARSTRRMTRTRARGRR